MRHAGCNAGANIEAIGLERLGSKAGRVMLTLRRERKAPSILPAMPAGSTRVKGRPDAEGSYGGTPVKRQAPIEGGVVWPDSTPSYSGMTCKMLVGKAPAFAAEPRYHISLPTVPDTTGWTSPAYGHLDCCRRRCDGPRQT